MTEADTGPRFAWALPREAEFRPRERFLITRYDVLATDEEIAQDFADHIQEEIVAFEVTLKNSILPKVSMLIPVATGMFPGIRQGWFLPGSPRMIRI